MFSRQQKEIPLLALSCSNRVTDGVHTVVQGQYGSVVFESASLYAHFILSVMPILLLLFIIVVNMLKQQMFNMHTTQGLVSLVVLNN